MKKWVSIIMAALMAAALLGCTPQPTEGADDTVIRLGALKGPTGMGMAGLMREEYQEKYDITIASMPDDIAANFIAGNLDMAAVPINLAGTLYNRMDGEVRIIAVSTLGVLYILQNGNEIKSLGDLAGRTLYATGQASTPQYILEYILEKNNMGDSVTVEYKADHAELATLMAAQEIELAMLPQPNVTAVMAKNSNISVAIDLNREWMSVTNTVMVQGCIIVGKDFLEQHEEAVKRFLGDYAASVDFVNEKVDEAAQIIVDSGIMAEVELAKKAIPYCNIVCLVGSQMHAAARDMIEVLYGMNPQSVGGELPGFEIYHTFGE